MKAPLVLIALLVVSIFAAGFSTALTGPKVKATQQMYLSDDDALAVDGVSAQSAAVTSVDVTSGISADEIEAEAAVQSDIEAKDSSYRAFPAQVLWGNGWALNGNEGHLAQIAIVQKIFVKDKNLSAQHVQVTRGILHLEGVGSYRFQSQTNQTDATTNPTSMTFDVYNPKLGKQQGIVGTITLNQESSFNGNFKTWKGTLKLSSGQSYDLHLAIDQRPLRKASADDLKKANMTRGSSDNSVDSQGQVTADMKVKENSNSGSGKSSWRNFFDKLFSRGNSGSGSDNSQ